jgi:hypothetical protein
MVDHETTHTVGTVMPTPMRAVIGVAALVNLFAAIGFATRQPWAVAAWPWETGPLSFMFLGAMLTAVATGAGWIAYSGEMGSLPAGFLNLTVMLGGIAAFLLFGDVTVPPPAALGVGVGVLALVNLALFWWTRRLPIGEPQPLPTLIRAAYLVFIVVLVVVGVSLILRIDGIMPWPLDPDTRVVFGWMFFSDAWYFAYALLRPDWQCARAQLWSFLGYDVVLMIPLLLHLRQAPSELLDNLVLYLLILAVSGGLAVYYLILNPDTRGWTSGRRIPHPAA